MQLGLPPSLPWTVKVDGRVDHGYHSRTHVFRKSKEVIIGDLGFADDTTLLGLATEVAQAEQILETTIAGLA